MLAKVDASLPKSLGDLDLQKQEERKKAKKKETGDAAPTETLEEEPLTSVPVNIRYLGRQLDLIA